MNVAWYTSDSDSQHGTVFKSELYYCDRYQSEVIEVIALVHICMREL